LRLEQDQWKVEWTRAGIDSICIRGAKLLSSKAGPTSSPAADWQVDARGERGLWIRPTTFELTQSMVWPFRYEPEMEVVARGNSLMPFSPGVTRRLDAVYTVRLEWPSNEVAISVGWDSDRLPSASFTLMTPPARLELALGAMSGDQIRPESWWVEIRDANAGTPIAVVDYDPAWRSQFESEKERIILALGELLVAIEHGGSTAVPGLAAKPVIDMWAALRGPLSPMQIGAMAGIGYEHFGEYGIADRDYFVKSTPPLCHLHCYPVGHPDWNRHLAFRDWLRTHPEGARAYGRVKRELAIRFTGDRMAYTEAKSDFIEAALAGKLDQMRT
jgi:GrpB-like predicted nucleotidyltransferase (UPF0157 family)